MRNNLIRFTTFEITLYSTYLLHYWYRILIRTERAATEKCSSLVRFYSNLLYRYSLFHVTSISWTSWTLSWNDNTLLSKYWMVLSFFIDTFTRERVVIILQKVLITHLLCRCLTINLNRWKLIYFQWLVSLPYDRILKLNESILILRFFFLNCIIGILI